MLIVSSLLTIMLFYKKTIEAHEFRPEAKIFSHASIEENFSDNAVIVVLNRQATHHFREYTIEDFSEVNAVSVTNLSEKTGRLVQRQIVADKTGDKRSIQQYIDDDMLVNIDAFRTILMIELGVRCKKNVLRSIRILEQHEDILSAEPDYYMQIGAAHPNSVNLRNQWAVNNIELEKAWNVTTGSGSVLVGIIDTGIDGTLTWKTGSKGIYVLSLKRVFWG